MHGSEIDLQVPKYVVSLFTADIISCVEFNQDGDLLATGDKGGRVVIFQRDPASKKSNPKRGSTMSTAHFKVTSLSLIISRV